MTRVSRRSSSRRRLVSRTLTQAMVPRQQPATRIPTHAVFQGAVTMGVRRQYRSPLVREQRTLVGMDRSVPAESLGERMTSGGAAGLLALLVHAGEGALHVAHAEPTQWLGLPGGGPMPDDRQPGQGSRLAREQVGEGVAGQVRGPHTVAGVAARRGEPRAGDV